MAKSRQGHSFGDSPPDLFPALFALWRVSKQGAEILLVVSEEGLQSVNAAAAGSIAEDGLGHRRLQVLECAP